MKRYNEQIVVRNTKELEMMDLSNVSDYAQVRVIGGLYGKQKYDTKQHYKDRTTYPLWQLKQIIGIMHEIEANVDPNWPEIARARYIYEVLGNNISYDFNRENYGNQQASNLSILLSREGICAGYSLLFKEMMDRQGIECDYVRGNAINPRGGQEKHAWNVLKINGRNIPLDLTWDARYIKNGRGLQYFGNDYQFKSVHVIDSDEVQYQYYYLSPDELENSDYRNYYRQQQPTNRDVKKEMFTKALRETYLKYSRLESPKEAYERIQTAMYRYVVYGDSNGFTRDRNARTNLENNVSSKEALEYIIDDYMKKFVDQENEVTIDLTTDEHYLYDAVGETMSAYSFEQAKSALTKYISTGKTSMFTNQGYSQARLTLSSHISNDEALKVLIDNAIEKELFLEKTINQYSDGKNNVDNKAFSSQDFELVSAPKDKNIFRKVMDWIKEKTKSLKKSRNNSSRNEGKNLSHKNDNDYYER